jgi:hypothetical protein
MPRMTVQGLNVAANSVSANVLAGQLYEFISRAMPVLLAATSSAVGINVTFLVGGVAIVNDQPISQANRFPILPDDIVTAVRRARGRLVLTFRNTTGGALTVNASVDVG